MYVCMYVCVYVYIYIYIYLLYLYGTPQKKNTSVYKQAGVRPTAAHIRPVLVHMAEEQLCGPILVPRLGPVLIKTGLVK